MVSSFNNLASGAAVLADQIYGPYGNQRVQQGTMSTSKGFTGQYSDALTGLDYYGARYYDPVVGVFVSADVVQGNGVGMNPYGYVAGNPETYSDPTGLSIWGDLGGLVQAAEQVTTQVVQDVQQFVDTEPLPVVGAAAVPAPLVVPTLALVGIAVGIGVIAGAIYTALTPQDLASGTIAPIDFNPPRQNNGGSSNPPPSGSDPPRQNNVDPSQPQTQTGGGGQLPPKGPPPATTSPKPPRKPLPRKSGGGFQSDQKLQNHYRKHNSEFDPPFTSPEQYEAAGLGFMQGDLPEGSLQGRFIAGNYEGDIIRYNTITNEFGMLTENGVLRSYYLPVDGIEEFWDTMMPNGSLELP